MALDREYKEFFLRDSQEAGGPYPDQEVGFPIEYQVNIPGGGTVTVKNRYLTEHYPSQDVFTKLFESLAFQLNVEDTATEDYQGLVKRGTQAQFDDGDTVDSEGYFLVYPQSMYDTLINNSGVISDITFDETDRIITVDFPSPTADLFIDTHTTFHYGSLGGVPPALPPSGIGKDLDYYIDTKLYNSLYLRTAGDVWIDTGVDLRSQSKIVNVAGALHLENWVNGSWLASSPVWQSGINYEWTATEGVDDWSFKWFEDSSLQTTTTIQKNTKVYSNDPGDGSINLYNAVTAWNDTTANLIATIPAPVTSTGANTIFGTETDPNTIPVSGNENDVYINTDTGEIWQIASSVWFQKVCFTKCSNYIPTYTFKATNTSQDVTSLSKYTSFDIIADDSLGTDESYDPDNVWQSSNYTKVSGTGTDDHKIFVSGNITFTDIMTYRDNAGTCEPIGYSLSIIANGQDGLQDASSITYFIAADDCADKAATTGDEYGNKTVSFSAILDTGAYANSAIDDNLTIVGELAMIEGAPHPCSFTHTTSDPFGPAYTAIIDNVLISNTLG